MSRSVHQNASSPSISRFAVADGIIQLHSPPKLFARKPATGDVKTIVDKKRKLIQNSYNSEAVLMNSMLVNAIQDENKEESKDSRQKNFKRQSFKFNSNCIEGSDTSKIIQRRQRDNFYSPKITRDKPQFATSSDISIGKMVLKRQSAFQNDNFKSDIKISSFKQPKIDVYLQKSQKKGEGNSFTSSNKNNQMNKNQNSCIYCDSHKDTIEVLRQKNSHLENQLQQKNCKINEINLKLQHLKQINEQSMKSLKNQKLQYVNLMNEKEDFCKMYEHIKLQLSKLLQKYKYLEIQNSMLMRLKEEYQELNLEKNKIKQECEHFKKELLLLRSTKAQSKSKTFTKKANNINPPTFFYEQNLQKRRSSNPDCSSPLKKGNTSDFDDTVSLNISSDCSYDI